MMKFTDLENEYIRTRLYGPNRQRRAISVLLPLITEESGAARMEELKQIIQEIVQIGQDAVALSQSETKEDSIDYDRLEQRTEKYRQIAHPWMRKCFLEQNAELPPEEQPQQTLDVAPQKPVEVAPQKPAPVDLSSLKDLASIMAGNAVSKTKDQNGQKGKEVYSGQESLLTIEAMKKKILKCRTWVSDFDMMRELEEYVGKISQINPQEGKIAGKMLENGKQLEKIFQHAFKAGGGSPNFTMENLRKEALSLQATPLEMQKLQASYQNGVRKKEEFRNQNRETVQIAGPDFDVQGSNPFFLSNLKSCNHWTVLVDETGNVFDQTYFELKKDNSAKGRFAAVLIPDGCDLPRLTYFHSTDSETQQIAQLLNSLLHTNVPCGIIGVSLDGMAHTALNYWYNGLERLFDLILRLLPINDQKTKLDILIENRGTSIDRMVQRSADASLYRLAKVDSARANKFELHANVFAKKTTNDPAFIAYNGYVDAIACAWNGKRSELVQILKDYGLKYTCLLEGTSQNLYEIMDDVHTNKLPSPELWTELLSSPNAQKKDSLVSWLLAEIGFIVRNNVENWKNYLTYFVAHLDSKAIDLRKLGKQVNFLKRYQPEDAKLPPRLRLLWLTAQLAESNHRGAVVVSAMNEFTKLIRDLYEEDAPLTCWATLHLAVNYTNAYEFKKAAGVVKNYLALIMRATWGKMLPAWINTAFDILLAPLEFSIFTPAAIPGLQYYAQLISSHGQHEAFAGHNAKAVKFFCEANRLFAKLSNDGGKRDISQTTAYLLTSLMDQASPNPKLLQQTLKSYFGSDLVAAAKSLASYNEAEDKYRHHILLRFLLSGKASEELKSAVLSVEKKWKTGYGHPWEMIEFYRALLVSDPKSRMAHLKKAHELSRGYDATLHVIDAVILGSILLEDSSVLSEYKALVEQCVREVPALGEARIQILREQPEQKRAPLELAKLILPFNFR